MLLFNKMKYVGDSREVRNIGYVSWRDPLAQLETMSGPLWKSVIKDEIVKFNKSIKDLSDTIKIYKNELSNARKELDIFPFITNNIEWRPGYTCRFKNSSLEFSAADFDTFNNYIWTTEDQSNGREIYTLNAYTENQQNIPLWQIGEVGPDIIYYEGYIYYQRIYNVHHKYAIWCVNAFTGNSPKLVHKTNNPSVNLSLIKTGNYLYIKEDNYKYTTLHKVNPFNQKTQLIDNKTAYQIPYGSEWVYREKDKDYYSISWLPHNYRPLWISPDGQYLLSRSYAGLTTIWYNKKQILKPFIGRFYINDKSYTDGKLEIYNISPYGQLYMLLNGATINKKIKYKSSCNKLIHSYKTTKSTDGEIVGYSVIKSSNIKKPHSLLIYGYGAYGLDTPIGKIWNEWGPLVKRGFAVVYAYIRGGGDGTDDWTQKARITGRTNAINDFEMVTRSARKLYNISAHNTIIYGRSAGGFLVGSMISRWPKGDLFGAVYAEVPFVDVLRTTTNPALPLTQLEYEEFGNPIKRVEDMAELIKISPVDTLPPEGSNIFVIARTGENDTEVYAYEPVKWILRLRGEGDGQGVDKLLGFVENEGHFFSGLTATRTRSEDLALLNRWVTEKISDNNIEMATRKTRQRKSRKSMEGGKRRKGRKTARKGRKARKTARKH